MIFNEHSRILQMFSVVLKKLGRCLTFRIAFAPILAVEEKKLQRSYTLVTLHREICHFFAFFEF